MTSSVLVCANDLRICLLQLVGSVRSPCQMVVGAKAKTGQEGLGLNVHLSSQALLPQGCSSILSHDSMLTPHDTQTTHASLNSWMRDEPGRLCCNWPAHCVDGIPGLPDA